MFPFSPQSRTNCKKHQKFWSFNYIKNNGFASRHLQVHVTEPIAKDAIIGEYVSQVSVGDLWCLAYRADCIRCRRCWSQKRAIEIRTTVSRFSSLTNNTQRTSLSTRNTRCAILFKSTKVNVFPIHAGAQKRESAGSKWSMRVESSPWKDTKENYILTLSNIIWQNDFYSSLSELLCKTCCREHPACSSLFLVHTTWTRLPIQRSAPQLRKLL